MLKLQQKLNKTFSNIPIFSYWGQLDSALRGAAFRGVRVDLLISHWNYSRPEMQGYLRSMLAINSVLPLHAGGKRGTINVVSIFVNNFVKIIIKYYQHFLNNFHKFQNFNPIYQI